MDFFENRVFVFTPKGDVIDLPQGSSPVDFAFAIHSDIGEHASGAKVNGKFVSLDTELHNGDIVEIETKRSVSPTRKWIALAIRITPEYLVCRDSSFANMAIVWKPPSMPINSGLKKVTRIFSSQRKATNTSSGIGLRKA